MAVNVPVVHSSVVLLLIVVVVAFLAPGVPGNVVILDFREIIEMNF